MPPEGTLPDLSRVAAFELAATKRGLRWRVLRLVAQARLQHVIFAWPFGVMSLFLAARRLPSARQWGLLILALASARGFVLAFGRFLSTHGYEDSMRTQSAVDRWIDWALAFGTGAFFLVSCGFLNGLTLLLAPAALAVLLVCAHLKRRHPLKPLARGLSMGIVPIGAWIGLCGSFDLGEAWPALVLATGATLWATGLDLIARCEVVPSGSERALRRAAICHIAAAAVLGMLAHHPAMGLVYLGGWVAFAVLLAYQHSLLKVSDSLKLSLQNFTINGFVTLCLLGAVVVDRFAP